MKRSLSVLLTLIIVIGLIPFAFTVTAGAAWRKGDVDRNGIVESKDYLMIKRAVLRTYTLLESELTAADASGDGDVTAVDYLMVKRDVLQNYFIDSFIEYSEGLEFVSVDGGQSYAVTGIGDCTDEHIAIPPEHNGLPVTGLLSATFVYEIGLKSIYIPASVTEIDSPAVFSCPDLEKLTVSQKNPVFHSAGNCVIETEAKKTVVGCKTSVIPDDGSVTVIGRDSFSSCDGLTSVVIPEGVTVIEESAFANCNVLASLSLPGSLKTIQRYAFANCSKLGIDLDVPDGVESIGDQAFTGSAITSFTIGKNVKSIGNGICGYCDYIESIAVDEENENYYGDGNCIITAEGGVLVQGCKKSVIPVDGSIKEIGPYAFYGIVLAADLTLPDSIEYIREGAFYSVNGVSTVRFGSGVKAVEKNAFKHAYVSSVILNEGLQSIGANAFSHISGLTAVTIYQNLVHIDEFAFQSCTSLSSVTFVTPANWKVTNVYNSSVAYLSQARLADPTVAAMALVSSFTDYKWDKE